MTPTKPCPTCGATITAALADAVARAEHDAKCPTRRDPRHRPGMTGGLLHGNAITPAGGRLGRDR